MAEDRLQDAQRAPDADAKVDGGNSPRPNRPTSALTSYLRRASMAKAEGPAIEGDEARSQRATIKVTSQDRGDSEERLEGALSKCVASADDLESRSSAEVGSLAGLPISRQQDRTHSAVMGGSSRGDMQTGPVGPSHPMLDAAAAAVAVYVEEERRDAATNEQFGESGGHERLSFEGDQSKFEERADAQVILVGARISKNKKNSSYNSAFAQVCLTDACERVHRKFPPREPINLLSSADIFYLSRPYSAVRTSTRGRFKITTARSSCSNSPGFFWRRRNRRRGIVGRNRGGPGAPIAFDVLRFTCSRFVQDRLIHCVCVLKKDTIHVGGWRLVVSGEERRVPPSVQRCGR